MSPQFEDETMKMLKNNLLVCMLGLTALSLACGEEAAPPDGPGGGETGTSGDGDGDGACVEQPVSPVELLNACTDAVCEPFANTKQRLPLLRDDGSLPPLP
jgi:hypothetical protein